MNSFLFSNSQVNRMLSDGAALAATDAVTLLQSGYKIAAKAMVKQYGLSYLDLVYAGQELGNSVNVSKAEAIELLDLQATELVRLLALRNAQMGAYQS